MALKLFLPLVVILIFLLLPYEKFTPNLLAYPLKRANEEFELAVLPKEQKQKFIYQLYQTRLGELSYIIYQKKNGFLEFSANRYISFVGKIKTNYPLDNSKKSEFQKNIKVLENLRDQYPANSEYWIKMQQALDVTRSLI